MLVSRFNQLKYSHKAAAGVHWIVWVKLQTCIWVERWWREWPHLSCSPALMARRDTLLQTRTEQGPIKPAEKHNTKLTKTFLKNNQNYKVCLFAYLFIYLFIYQLSLRWFENVFAYLFVFLHWCIGLFILFFNYLIVFHIPLCIFPTHIYSLFGLFIYLFVYSLILLYFHVYFQILSCVVLQDSLERCHTVLSLLQPLSPAVRLAPLYPWPLIHLSHWSESDPQEPVALRRSRSLC